MTDVPIPEDDLPEEVEDDRVKFIRQNQQILEWIPPDNEYELNEKSFDAALAWQALLTLPTCQEMMIREKNQQLLNLVVGVNVTQEFPWKQIPYRNLRDLFDDLPNGQLLHDAFQGYDPDSHVLIGYVPLITQDMDDPPPGDPCVLYVNPADAKLALAIIRNLETFERLMLNKRLLKRPRKWVSLGSEGEVNLTIAHRYHENVDVEIQSVYPLTIPANKEFSFRLSNDVRDGYVELVPSESAHFENVSRRRITVGIQSSFQRIDIEQQTDPTFPTNAWAQYLYEIDEEDDGLDKESEEEGTKSKPVSKSTTAEPNVESKPIPEVSDNIKLLLRTLEFNQIDMYRNDYPYISNKTVVHYTSPYLKEILCFANIGKSHHRYMCGYDWYPALAGLIVASYTFSTAATIEIAEKHQKVVVAPPVINFFLNIYLHYTTGSSIRDDIQRNVLEHKPILMWSFSDNLNYKLEFESALEVVTLSFCPYEANVLLGGATNGQIILWDLQNRAENLDVEEMLSSAQVSYRVLMNEFLKWTILINEDILVPPAVISDLENSQKSTITTIQWLGSNCFVNTFGKVYTVPNGSTKYRYFITSSMDGTIAFWNLDGDAVKTIKSGQRSDLPKALTHSESLYKGKVLKPVFTIVFNEPLTAFIADTPLFRCEVREKDAKVANNLYNFAIETAEVNLPEVKQSCIVSSFYGRIERLTWLGLYSDTDARETINTSVNFAHIHDGPVVSMKRNPIFPWLFVSIGRTVFAVWKEDYYYSPIFWRKRKSDLTAVAWSESRPSVLFLTRIDGSIEAWDILSRDDDAILNDTLGGGIVTNICEHKIAEPEKLLGIGDYNSSLRLVKLPMSLYKALHYEVEEMEKYILKEESRKKQIQAWEQQYNEKNREFIKSKLQAERDAHAEMERIEKEATLKANRRAKEEEDAKKDAEPGTRMTYTERMKKEWHELNLNRLLDILMSRKRVNEKQLNEQTVLEKERLAYELAKKESLAQILKGMAAEIAAVRLHILPQEIPDLKRNEMIQSTVESIMQTVESYQSIEDEANATIKEYSGFVSIDYAEFLQRGQQRRKHLNKSLGGNTERWYWYENMIENNLITDCDWGLETFAELLQHTNVETGQPSELSLSKNKEEEEADQADIEGD